MTVDFAVQFRARGQATSSLAYRHAVFANNKMSKRLNPTGLVISEVVFGILLTAVAVQLVVSGLGLLGIIQGTPACTH